MFDFSFSDGVSKVLDVNKIMSFFNSHGLNLYETYFSFDREIDVELKTNDLDVLLQLINENCIKSVFYSFRYVDVESFLITEEDNPINNYNSDVKVLIYEDYMRIFQSEQEKFNSKFPVDVESKPVSLCVYCLLNGSQVGVLFDDGWYLDLPDKDDVIFKLSVLLDDMCSNAMYEIHASEEIQENDVFQRIINHLDATDEWHVCTNQRLRRNYCYELASKFEVECGYRVSVFKIIDALELRWNRYKLRKN